MFFRRKNKDVEILHRLYLEQERKQARYDEMIDYICVITGQEAIPEPRPNHPNSAYKAGRKLGLKPGQYMPGLEFAD